jgi:hypothetical protein
MTIGANTIRKALPLFAAAALAGLAAPAALADPPQGHRATPSLDVTERQVMGERAATLGKGTNRTARFVGRDQPDGYQPGVRTASRSGGSSPSGGSFAWSDAGIGALAGVAFALLAGGALLSLRTRARVAHS